MRSPRSTRFALTLAALTAALAAPSVSEAAPTLRFSTSGQGGLRVVGTTFGFECAGNPVAPSGTTVDCTGQTQANLDDASPDIFWSDNTAGVAAAPGTAVTLDLPAGATVTYARLYWAARRQGGGGLTIQLTGPDNSPQTITAGDSATQPGGGGESLYQATADVTAQVVAAGGGAYKAEALDTIALADLDEDRLFAAWSMVVIYDDATAPFHRVAIYDGLDVVDAANSPSVMVATDVPNGPPHGELTVIAYDGDAVTTGTETVRWDATNLGNGTNPNDNFFNSSRTSLGAATSGASDVPKLAGDPGTMAGFDLDTVDVSSLLTAGQAAPASVEVQSSADAVYLGAIVTDIAGCRQNADCSAPTPSCNLTTGECEPGGGTGGAGGGGTGGAGGGGTGGGGTGGTGPGGGSSTSSSSGETSSTGGAGTGGAGGAADFSGLAVQGGGCGCSVPASSSDRGLLALGLAGLVGMIATLRRRRR